MPNTKIDEKSVVPLSWFITGLLTVITMTGGGVVWITTVNFRLERIEEKLGIPTYHAFELENKNYEPINTSGLHGPVRLMCSNPKFNKTY